MGTTPTATPPLPATAHIVTTARAATSDPPTAGSGSTFTSVLAKHDTLPNPGPASRLPPQQAARPCRSCETWRPAAETARPPACSHPAQQSERRTSRPDETSRTLAAREIPGLNVRIFRRWFSSSSSVRVATSLRCSSTGDSSPSFTRGKSHECGRLLDGTSRSPSPSKRRSSVGATAGGASSTSVGPALTKHRPRP